MNIKKAAEMFALSTDTLRYYERVGVIPPVHRNSSGYREYNTNDLNWIYLAKNLRNAGLSVESLINWMSWTKNWQTCRKSKSCWYTKSIPMMTILRNSKPAREHQIK